MLLSAGTKLGPYEILAPLGTGGMGEVYRARDSKLNRDVALKVLSAALAQDAAYLARFQREAQVLAALNHPNIAQIYGLEQNAIVMELVEGQEPRGPLPLDDALKIAKQVADALEAAHEKGIVHRDLKPANIKVTPTGVVKVLDFGLAKAAEIAPTASTDNSPTLTMRATQSGVILGTASYMAPEQAAGKPVDRRADIWSFGVVLWELLAGRRLFDGETISHTLADVLRAPIDLEALPKETPAGIRVLVRRCLERDRRKRLQWIGDGRIAIEEALANPLAAEEAAPPPRGGSKIWIATAIACIATAAAVAGWMRPSTAGNGMPAMTLSILPPSGLSLTPIGTSYAPQLSPDGAAVLFRTSDNQIYVRRLESLEARPVPGWALNAPFWSADSTTVVYVSNPPQLVKVRMPDGAPEVLAGNPGSTPRGGSWSPAGTILIATYPIWTSVAAAGAEPKLVETPTPLKEGRWWYPEFLSEGQDFLSLFVPYQNPDDAAIYLASFRDGKAVNPVLLIKNHTAARYTPAGGGRILFVRNDNLYSQRLNRRTRKLEGEAELVVQEVASQPSMTIHQGDFSVARNGTVAWRPGKAAVSQVTEFDRSGNQVGTSGPTGSFDRLALSLDEGQLLVSSVEAGGLMEVGRPGWSDLPRGVQWFGWFAGSAKLLGFRRGDRTFVAISASGSGEVHVLRKVEFDPFPALGISSDGEHVFANTADASVSWQLEGTPEAMGDPRALERSQLDSAQCLSPDGRWVVSSTIAVGGGLYVQPLPGPGPRRQIASGTARGVVWRKDGREILYFSPDGLMSVSVEWNGNLKFGPPRKLFSGLRLPSGATSSSVPLAVSHDGSRIFWAQGVEQPESNVIHVKTNAVK
jgi:serine/threonine protein kinase